MSFWGPLIGAGVSLLGGLFGKKAKAPKPYQVQNAGEQQLSNDSINKSINEAKDLASFRIGLDKDLGGFQRGLREQEAQANFNRGETRAQSDFGRGETRAQSDFTRGETRAQSDFGRQSKLVDQDYGWQSRINTDTQGAQTERLQRELDTRKFQQRTDIDQSNLSTNRAINLASRRLGRS